MVSSISPTSSPTDMDKVEPTNQEGAIHEARRDVVNSWLAEFVDTALGSSDIE